MNAALPVTAAHPGRQSLGAGTLALVLGGAVLVAPVLVDLWRAGGGNDHDNQFPLVALTAPWLFWRERAAFGTRAPERSARGGPVALTLALGLPAYVLARVAGLTLAAMAVTWGLVVAVLWAELGAAGVRRLWFPLAYVLLLATPSNRLVLLVAMPLRLWLTATATGLAGAMGIDAGASGTIVQVDGYQLMVANACSGVNSLVGMAAVCLFYAHAAHRARPVAVAVLLALMLPVAVLANVLRVLAMIVATHLWGADWAEAWLHPVAGFVVFALAVGLLCAVDEGVVRRMWR